MLASSTSGMMARLQGLRRPLFEILEHGRRRDPLSRAVDAAMVGLILADVATALAQSIPEVDAAYGAWLTAFDRFCVAIFIIEFALRLWTAPEHPALAGLAPLRARLAVLRSPLMLVDAVAIVPVVLEVIFSQHPLVRLLRLLRFLKLARYSPALSTVGMVFASERRALLACAVIIVGALLASAAAMHAVEGHLQPDRLGDMPKAMWWAASMLAKIGGGELTPVTALGRVIAAATVIMGIFCFALPVAILGRGFYAEIRRRDFVVTFALVARVPLFRDLDATALTDLVNMLSARTVSAGTTIVQRGERGSAMYLIASGRVEVLTPQRTAELSDGDFFGEMALLSTGPRTATVRALRTTDLLVLEAEDFSRLTSRSPTVRALVEEAARNREGVAAGSGAAAPRA